MLERGVGDFRSRGAAIRFHAVTATVPQPAAMDVGAAARAVDASKVYGEGDAEVRALDHIDVEFATAHYSAIMGPSGSGKSTLLHCLAGLDHVTSGHVFLGDIDITDLREKSLTRVRRDRIGFIFQSFNLIPTLTALENITLPHTLAGRDPDREWLEHVIDIVGLRSRLRHRPSELSGGQQQRVAVARALASRPDIIFADEPTGNVDSKAGAEILGFMRQVVRDHGQTIVMVTHDPTAASYSDRVVFLADGAIVDELADPTTDAVLDFMRKLGG
jgi:putative ABC transport system ATP-binding protein